MHLQLLSLDHKQSGSHLLLRLKNSHSEEENHISEKKKYRNVFTKEEYLGGNLGEYSNSSRPMTALIIIVIL